MKGILLDENVPSRLTFSPSVPVTTASAACGRSTPDEMIWAYAKREACVIVTKDADFSERILVDTPPPWVVHLRFGNMRRREFHELLARVWPRIAVLLQSHKLINVFSDRIEVVG